MNLSEHFTLAELTRSSVAAAKGIENVPREEDIKNLQRTAQMLERIRSHLGGHPVLVLSGFRSPELNRAVGGVAGSDHAKGMAADIAVPRYGSAFRVSRALAPARAALGIGQLIYECVKGKEWVHVSTRPPEKVINSVITVSDAGTFLGIKEKEA